MCIYHVHVNESGQAAVLDYVQQCRKCAGVGQAMEKEAKGERWRQ